MGEWAGTCLLNPLPNPKCSSAALQNHTMSLLQQKGTGKTGFTASFIVCATPVAGCSPGRQRWLWVPELDVCVGLCAGFRQMTFYVHYRCLGMIAPLTQVPCEFGVVSQVGGGCHSLWNLYFLSVDHNSLLLLWEKCHQLWHSQLCLGFNPKANCSTALQLRSLEETGAILPIMMSVVELNYMT